MTTNRIGIVAVLTACAGLGGVALGRVSASQAVSTPRGDQVRFQLVGNEPIAGPDGRALVTNWSVTVFKDRATDQCYVVFKTVDSISTAPPTACR
jgi:hypothetical protein